MSNHCHLTLSTPRLNLDLAMGYLFTEVSRRIAAKSGRINHVFGGRYKPNVLINPQAWSYVYKYVYRNPVRAGLSSATDTYPYSTLTRLKQGKCEIPVVEYLGPLWKWVPRDPGERIDWLNHPTSKELEGLIALGLRRSTFQLSQHKRHREALDELERTYRYAHPSVAFGEPNSDQFFAKRCQAPFGLRGY